MAPNTKAGTFDYQAIRVKTYFNKAKPTCISGSLELWLLTDSPLLSPHGWFLRRHFIAKITQFVLCDTASKANFGVHIYVLWLRASYEGAVVRYVVLRKVKAGCMWTDHAELKKKEVNALWCHKGNEKGNRECTMVVCRGSNMSGGLAPFDISRYLAKRSSAKSISESPVISAEQPSLKYLALAFILKGIATHYCWTTSKT